VHGGEQLIAKRGAMCLGQGERRRQPERRG
jgi:hypothetical protein